MSVLLAGGYGALTPDHVLQALDLLDERLGVALHGYRRPTVMRRLEQRMRVSGFTEPEAYLERLRTSAAEPRALLETLLVSVTSFFRDPDVFAALERRVIPELLGRAEARRPLRVWVPGVSTGEEAWSLAMLLAERRGLGDGSFEILGTDIDRTALQVARAATYPVGVPEQVPAHLATRYLEVGGGVARVRPELRCRVRFVEHDVIGSRRAPQEAILAHFDLVSFRNVLIYFGPELQVWALERLGAVLAPGAALVLGPAETAPRSLAAHFREWPGLPRRLNVLVRRTAG